MTYLSPQLSLILAVGNSNRSLSSLLDVITEKRSRQTPSSILGLHNGHNGFGGGLVCVLWCWLAFNQESAPELSCVQVDLFGRLSHQESLLLKFRKKATILLVVSVWVWLLLKSWLPAIVVFSILKEQFDNNKRWERSWKEISSNMITTFVKKVVCSVV